jgi:hypothetical protein
LDSPHDAALVAAGGVTTGATAGAGGAAGGEAGGVAGGAVAAGGVVAGLAAGAHDMATIAKARTRTAMMTNAWFLNTSQISSKSYFSYLQFKKDGFLCKQSLAVLNIAHCDKKRNPLK